MQLNLIVEKGIRMGETIPITEFPAVIGRGDQCQHQFKDIGVSRTHFVLEYINDHIFIRDSASTNGIKVNGVKITEPTILQQGDVIVVGKVLVLKVWMEDHNAHGQAVDSAPLSRAFFPSGNTPLSEAVSSSLMSLYDRNFKNFVRPPQTKGTRVLPGPKTGNIPIDKEVASPKKTAEKTPHIPAMKPDRAQRSEDGEVSNVRTDPFIEKSQVMKPKGFSEEGEGISAEDFERLHIDVSQTSILTPQAELYHSYRALKTIYEVVQHCNNETNTEYLLQSALTFICKSINADRGAVVVRWADNAQYEVKAFLGDEKVRLPISRTVLGEVIEKGMSLILRHPSEDEKYRYAESIRLQKTKAIICSPLISRDKVFGAIYLDRTRTGQEPFQHQDLELLSAIGIHIGAHLEKTLLLEEVTRVNSYLKAVIESVPVGIYTMSLQGIFSSWSSTSEKIFEFIEEEVVGRVSFAALFYDRESGEKIFRSVAKAGVFLDESQMVRRDGSIFPCRFGISPIVDNTGKLLGYTGFYQDITEEKQQQEQLFSQEKLAALGMLAAGVAHDFNNIFSLMLGYTSMALGEAPENVKNYLTKVMTHIERAGQIAGNLLRYSRQETMQFCEESPSHLLEEVLSLVEKELYASDITLVKNLQTLRPQPLIPGQIQEVFLNIILNARDAMPKGGKLTISTWMQDDENRLLFEDSGEGISPENLKKIFTPFFSTKKNRSDKVGTGLGLATSYQIVQKHGGKIFVESTLQHGTQFLVVLPIKANSEQEE